MNISISGDRADISLAGVNGLSAAHSDSARTTQAGGLSADCVSVTASTQEIQRSLSALSDLRSSRVACLAALFAQGKYQGDSAATARAVVAHSKFTDGSK